MEQGKLMANQNLIEQLQARFKELESGFKAWLAKQSLSVEAAVITATSTAQGAAIGGFMVTLTNDLTFGILNIDIFNTLPTPPQANLTPQAMASFKQAQALAGGPFVQTRNFAVMTGVNAGISCVMRRLRGKEDVQSSYVFFGEWHGPNQAANAVTSGLFFALVQGGLCQLGQQFSQPPTEDIYYSKTRSMLSNLGLQNYEKNFKKGLLSDSTLRLLTDSGLRDVKIPPGPRLLIIDHIQRDPKLKGRRS
ncbi:hypothetical protein UlMin_023779 [Ulmus minor]